MKKEKLETLRSEKKKKGSYFQWNVFKNKSRLTGFSPQLFNDQVKYLQDEWKIHL